MLYALAAGVCGVSALGFFYSGLAIGTMSIVAPISASGAALPVLVGVLSGDALSALVAAGLVVTMAGVILASLEAVEEEETHERTRTSRLSILFALCAALGFGGYFALSDPAADFSVLWLLFFVRILGVVVLAVIVLVRRTPLPVGRDRGLVAGAGVLDVSATGLYARRADARRAEHRLGRRRALPGDDGAARARIPRRAAADRAGDRRGAGADRRGAHRAGVGAASARPAGERHGHRLLEPASASGELRRTIRGRRRRAGAVLSTTTSGDVADQSLESVIGALNRCCGGVCTAFTRTR